MKPEPDKLTTREAWMEQARWWDLAAVCDCGCGRMTVAPRVAGLCSSLGVMRFRGQITAAQEQEMLDALPKSEAQVMRGVRPFLWPTTPDGAKERAAFCREQAKNQKGKA